MRKHTFVKWIGLLLLPVLQSCSPQKGEEISLLSFNVWQEGTSVPNGLEKILDVVLKTDADVVCFVEVRNYEGEDWTEKIVKELAEAGVYYHRGYAGGDVSFISKYPLDEGRLIFGNEDKGTVVRFEMDVNGKSMVLYGSHLDYTYYASNLPRGYNGGDPDWKLIDDGKGKPLAQTDTAAIQAYGLRSTRDEAIKAFLQEAQNEKHPVVLMGDFNEPSHLDWTADTKDHFGHSGVVMEWHNTKRLEAAGYTDAYRAHFPDVLNYPGITWPAYAHEKGSTSWTPLSDERDRIDYIFFKGKNLRLKGAKMVGPLENYVHNQLDSSFTEKEVFISFDSNWPSDHKAVLAKFDLN